MLPTSLLPSLPHLPYLPLRSVTGNTNWALPAFGAVGDDYIAPNALAIDSSGKLLLAATYSGRSTCSVATFGPSITLSSCPFGAPVTTQCPTAHRIECPLPTDSAASRVTQGVRHLALVGRSRLSQRSTLSHRRPASYGPRLSVAPRVTSCWRAPSPSTASTTSFLSVGA